MGHRAEGPVVESDRRVNEYTHIISQPDPYWFERGDACRVVVDGEPVPGEVVDFSAEKAVVELDG